MTLRILHPARRSSLRDAFDLRGKLLAELTEELADMQREHGKQLRNALDWHAKYRAEHNDNRLLRRSLVEARATIARLEAERALQVRAETIEPQSLRIA